MFMPPIPYSSMLEITNIQLLCRKKMYRKFWAYIAIGTVEFMVNNVGVEKFSSTNRVIKQRSPFQDNSGIITEIGKETEINWTKRTMKFCSPVQIKLKVCCFRHYKKLNQLIIEISQTLPETSSLAGLNWRT